MHRLGQWPQCRAAPRFVVGLRAAAVPHRHVALLVLAVSILAIELAVHPHETDRLVLSAALAIVVLPGVRIGLPFFKSLVGSQSGSYTAES
ncbi:MAG TPA: hypothetical protein VI455_17510 [Terriglobia bacterium]